MVAYSTPSSSADETRGLRNISVSKTSPPPVLAQKSSRSGGTLESCRAAHCKSICGSIGPFHRNNRGFACASTSIGRFIELSRLRSKPDEPPCADFQSNPAVGVCLTQRRSQCHL